MRPIKHRISATVNSCCYNFSLSNGQQRKEKLIDVGPDAEMVTTATQGESTRQESEKIRKERK